MTRPNKAETSDDCLEQIMTKNVLTVENHTTLLQACNLMYERRYSCLLIIDKQQPIGIITERDMVRILIDCLESESARDADVNAYMTAKPFTLNTDAKIVDAVEIMLEKGIRHMPVIDQDKKLAGLVTYSDLIRNKQSLIENHENLIAESADLSKTNEELLMLSLEDPLLKIGNRRAMETDLHYAHETLLRYNMTYSVILLDVDYFKKYNDHYGHKKGDEVLQFIANYLKSCIRGSDRLYRYGGEEFLLLLPETGLDGADLLVKRIINGLEKLHIVHEASPFGHISLSCGISSEDDEKHRSLSWEQLVNRADEALYTAKSQGRNQHALSYGADDNHNENLDLAVKSY